MNSSNFKFEVSYHYKMTHNSSKITPNTVVLLTAAVTPSKDVPFTSLNADVRLPLYQEAISFWSQICVLNKWSLFVVETTGASEGELFKFVDPNGDNQFRAFSPNPDLNKLGKGALESACLDYAFTELEKTYGKNTTVHKVSGKLIIRNYKKVLISTPGNAINIRRSIYRSVCHSRVFSLTVGSWNQFFTGLYKDINDLDNSRYFEHVLAYKMISAEFHQKFAVSQFRALPQLVGYSGTNGMKYGGFSKNGWSNLKELFERRYLLRFKKRLT